MPVNVKIPTQLRQATEGEAAATADGTTVGEVLDSLYERFGELRSRIAEDGGLRRFVNVYVDGEDIRFLEGLDTPVQDGDEVTILPAVAGGSADADPLGEFAGANSRLSLGDRLTPIPLGNSLARIPGCRWGIA
jgi:molybdopterin synthase sulfur carrier subunit